MTPYDRYIHWVSTENNSRLPETVTILTKAGEYYDLPGGLNKMGNTFKFIDAANGAISFVDIGQIESITVGGIA